MTIDALVHVMPFVGFIGLFWYLQLIEKKLAKHETLINMIENIIQRHSDNKSRIETLISRIDQRTQQDI